MGGYALNAFGCFGLDVVGTADCDTACFKELRGEEVRIEGSEVLGDDVGFDGVVPAKSGV